MMKKSKTIASDMHLELTATFQDTPRAHWFWLRSWLNSSYAANDTAMSSTARIFHGGGDDPFATAGCPMNQTRLRSGESSGTVVQESVWARLAGIGPE
jgi:hypothetical protein